ncbi:MAG: DUF2637 domain-containing protein [Natronosporangium sp.]
MNLTKLYAYGGAGVVGAVAAVVSFGHLRHLALAAGESAVAAALLPISVDGLLVAAAAMMWSDSRSGLRARLSARVAFGTGCAATVAGNVASARPTVTGWLVAAWAPLALLLVTEMLARRGRQVGDGVESLSTSDSPESVARPVRPRKAGKRTAAERVSAARERLGPAATQAEVAKRARVSVRTAARYWRDTQPDGSRKLPEPSPNSREHTGVPELVEVPR